MMMSVTVAVVLSLASIAAGYSSGPPVGGSGPADLCSTMFPTGHGVEKQTTTVPYSYVLSATCFKAGSTIKVAVKANDDYYFEGLFTQVQEESVKGSNYGTFSMDEDVALQGQTCFNIENSSISHSEKHHFTTRVFTWHAPADVDTEMQAKTLHLRSTVVKNKETFWVDWYSDAITYDAGCVEGEFNEVQAVEESDSHEDHDHDDMTTMDPDTSGSSLLLPGVLLTLLAGTIAQLLQ